MIHELKIFCIISKILFCTFGRK